MMRARTGRRSSRFLDKAVGAAGAMLESLEPRTLFSAAPMTPAQVVAQSNNAFAFDLMHELQKEGQTGNMFLSPYSVSTALEMLLQGAKGQTASDIINTLHLPAADVAQAGIQALYQLFQADPATAGYTLSTANRLWVNQNYKLLDSFLTATQNTFGAAPQSLDFSDPKGAAATINQWVSDQTHGKIKELIPASAINGLTRLILTNAIYFKGNWATSFDASLTKDSNFQVSPTQYATDTRMEISDNFGYYQQDGPAGFQAVDIPYTNNNLDMLVILPTASTLDGFASQVNADLFSQITSNLSTAEVDVKLPKFTLKESYDLGAPLKALGMASAFGDGADLSGISGESLQVSDVVHKTYIQVDETGTEAAGVTGSTVVPTCVGAPPQMAVFNADHPFLFAIRDRATNTILFLGQVTNPAESALIDGTAPSDGTPVGQGGSTTGDPTPPGTVGSAPVNSPVPPGIGPDPVSSSPPSTSAPPPSTTPPTTAAPSKPVTRTTPAVVARHGSGTPSIVSGNALVSVRTRGGHHASVELAIKATAAVKHAPKPTQATAHVPAKTHKSTTLSRLNLASLISLDQA